MAKKNLFLSGLALVCFSLSIAPVSAEDVLRTEDEGLIWKMDSNGYDASRGVLTRVVGGNMIQQIVVPSAVNVNSFADGTATPMIYDEESTNYIKAPQYAAQPDQQRPQKMYSVPSPKGMSWQQESDDFAYAPSISGGQTPRAIRVQMPDGSTKVLHWHSNDNSIFAPSSAPMYQRPRPSSQPYPQLRDYPAAPYSSAPRPMYNNNPNNNRVNYRSEPQRRSAPVYNAPKNMMFDYDGVPLIDEREL